MTFPKYILRSSIFISSLFIIINASAQDIQLDIHGKKMHEFIDLELKLGGKLIEGKDDIIIPKAMATPLTYKRNEIGIPDLVVTYTFSSKDSLIDYIKYEWELSNFENTPKKQLLGLQKAMIKKHQFLADQLHLTIGEGRKTGNLSDLNKMNSKGGLRSLEFWKPNDTLMVDLFAQFSNYKDEEPPIFARPINTVSVSVSKSAKPVNPVKGAEAVNKAKKNFGEFMFKLESGNEDGAKGLLSLQIRDKMTSPMLKTIKALIKSEPFDLYDYDAVLINNVSYLIIDYAYANDNEDPAKVVRATFDKEGLIIAMQLRTRERKV